MALSGLIVPFVPCKNLCGKIDQLDQLEVELCQLSQVGHAKNHSALSALFALLQVKVQKVQIVQCKFLYRRHGMPGNGQKKKERQVKYREQDEGRKTATR